jgi:CubicO group peptidase (beta-lactamase class C family)
VVRQGKVAFHRTYGHHLYDRRRPVAKNDIYDLASVTKIAATTLAVMKLYEEGKLDLTQTLGHYLPELKGTNKEHLIIQEVMAHQAGLKAWIPFYKQTLDERKRPQAQYYRRQPDNEYCIRVSEGMYMCRRDVDSLVWQRVYESELLPEKSYVYSDLGMILMAKVVESLVGSSLDEYVKKHFYQPMSLSEIGFNPIKMGLDRSRIVPTEQDDYFRYQLVHGDVHDMAAAMLGGIAGHAGLFARAQDLGTVLAMLANYGEFQGRRYLKKETIQRFIAPFSSKEPRRGLGFDRKDKKADGSASNVPNEASDLVFGHLGFTGIAAWVDPKEDLVFIFLSNRTYPSGENMKLVKKDTRRRMHSLVYQAIFK